MAKPFVWYRGAHLTMALKVAEGTVSGAEPVRCALKKAIGSEPVGDELMTFAVSFTPALAGEPARWTFVGTPEQSIDLDAGQYLADARIEYSAQVIITRTIPILIKETVTTQ